MYQHWWHNTPGKHSGPFKQMNGDSAMFVKWSFLQSQGADKADAGGQNLPGLRCAGTPSPALLSDWSGQDSVISHNCKQGAFTHWSNIPEEDFFHQLSVFDGHESSITASPVIVCPALPSPPTSTKHSCFCMQQAPWFLDGLGSLLHDIGSKCQPAAIEKPVNYAND